MTASVSSALERGERCRKDPSMTLGLSCVTAATVLVLSFQGVLAASPGIISFDMHPTSELLDQDQSRRHLLFDSSASDSTPDLQDFHAHRHLSRYERHHRENAEIDLQSGWEGIYTRIKIPTLRMTDATCLNRRKDPYHAAPLNQGYGTHYVNLWVGTPTPQRKTVIVDTGSHYTAFPCVGCKGCGEDHHTDPYFQPQESQSFRPLELQRMHSWSHLQRGQVHV